MIQPSGDCQVVGGVVTPPYIGVSYQNTKLQFEAAIFPVVYLEKL